MRILFLGLNYSPEPISTGVYSTGLCEELVARGHEVCAVVGKPYYPQWRIYDEFRGGGVRISEESGVLVTRVPHYVPADPTGPKRIVHHASFAFSALVPMLKKARTMKPDIVMTVAPSLLSAPVAHLAARVARVRSWLHVQDFEVGTAFATGLVDPNGIAARMARGFERFVLRRFDCVSSISLEMCHKAKAVVGEGLSDVFEFRNWANIEEIKPLDHSSIYRTRWCIATPHVALYSGNIANKQGIEILVDVARRLQSRTDLTFVICGQGPNREALQTLATGLTNIQFHDLQPPEQLNELLGLATVHLLPQKAGAADLVLPSKLTNMLASGRPIVATAHPGTGLARELAKGGLVTAPGDVDAMATAILRLIEEPGLHRELSTQAALRAREAWDKGRIIDGLCAQLDRLVAK